MKKYYALLLCSLLMIGCGTPAMDSENTDENETNMSDNAADQGPIVIGGIAALTGDAAAYGLTDQKVTNLMIEQVNQDGGINGRPLEIIWEDAKCNPSESSKAAQKLINVDNVHIILGGVCSGETLAAAPITEKAEVILFSALSSSPEVTTAGDFVFRTSPSDTSQAGVMAAYANDNFQKVALLHEQTDYAVAVAETFKKNYQGELIIESFLTSESDFKTRITKLKNTEGLEALYLVPQGPTKGDIIFKQLEEQEVDIPLLTNEVMAADPAVVTKHKDYITSVGGIIGADFLISDESKLKILLEAYRTKYGEDPAFTSFSAVIADRLNVIAKVLREVDDVTDTKAIRDAIYGTQEFKGGIIPNLSFDENGDANINHSLVKFDGETFVPLDQ